MSEAIVFPSATPRMDLPLLFAAQAEKEVFVNEALARLDAVVHGAIEGETSVPPAQAEDGRMWLVGPSPTRAWAAQAGTLACRQSGNWLFVTPRDGMRLLNRATGQEVRFAGSWRTPQRPAAPSGGATVDVQARDTIATLIQSLIEAGIFAAP